MAEQLAPTDSIGIHLKEEYGSKPPNTHIGCFYIKLGQEICQYPRILLKAIDALKSILGSTKWGKTEPGVFFFKAPETTTTDERKHEEEMNAQIREKLMTDLQGHDTGIHIILSRACLYTENSREITTEEIGEKLTYVCEHNVTGSTHINYFYLFIQAVVREESFDKKQAKIKNEKVQSKALEELKTLPGNWKSVKPQETWPGTFFGFFPNGLNERHREELLNGEVRIPLIERLEAKLEGKKIHDSLGLELKVQVIITRACKYTPTE